MASELIVRSLRGDRMLGFFNEQGMGVTTVEPLLMKKHGG
jgi:hypothetical protein